jgi:hypothetical protein
MNTISKLLGLIIVLLSFAILALGITSYGYIVLSSPRQPDLPSGHVIPTMIADHYMSHVEYLTEFERTMFGLSYLFVGVGLVGIFGYLFATGKLKKPTSFG